LGRSGEWDRHSLTGNPVTSFGVESHRIAYRTDVLKRGYQESSAIPLVKIHMCFLPLPFPMCLYLPSHTLKSCASNLFLSFSTSRAAFLFQPIPFTPSSFALFFVSFYSCMYDAHPNPLSFYCFITDISSLSKCRMRKRITYS
jgi:hypothetical protein